MILWHWQRRIHWKQADRGNCWYMYWRLFGKMDWRART